MYTANRRRLADSSVVSAPRRTALVAPHLLGREHQRVLRVPCVSTHSTLCTAPHLLGREHQCVPEPIGPEAQDLFIHSAVSHAITGSNARKH
jgi:hypothetical protein